MPDYTVMPSGTPTTVVDPATGQSYAVPVFDPSKADFSSLQAVAGNGSPAPAGYGVNVVSNGEDAGAWNAAHPNDTRTNFQMYTPEHQAAVDKANATDPLYNFVNSGPTIDDAFRNVALLTGGALLGGGFFNALGAGAAGAGALGAGTAGVDAGATAGALGTAGTGVAAAGAGTAASTVSELVLTAAAQGLSLPAIATAVGVPVATVSAILSSGTGATPSAGGGTTEPPVATVDPLTVTPSLPVAANPGLSVISGGVGIGMGLDPTATPSTSPGPDPQATTIDPVTVTPMPSSTLPAVLGAGVVAGGLALGSGGGGTELPVQTTTPSITPAPTQPLSTGPSLTTTPPAVSNIPDSLGTLIKNGDVHGIGDWIAANPAKAIELGLLASSAVSTVAGGGNGSSASGVYNPVKLPASFSATSPSFKLAGRGDPRVKPSQDWTHYGQGPEQSFFTGVNQPAAIRNLMVQPSAAPVRITSGNDSVLVPDRIQRKPVPVGYAHGGYAVKGPGDGRSDSIDARLSDGEYVVDAETVALLGNGSNKAGADKLDHFRVNLRKSKGRNLARGDFSVHAKDPSAYMSGGQ